MKKNLIIPVVGLIISFIAAFLAVILNAEVKSCMILIGIFVGMLTMDMLKSAPRKYDGYLQYEVNDEGKEVWTFVVNGDPNEWHDYDDILLKVQENPNV